VGVVGILCHIAVIYILVIIGKNETAHGLNARLSIGLFAPFRLSGSCSVEGFGYSCPANQAFGLWRPGQGEKQAAPLAGASC